MATINTTENALRRAERRFEHASRQLADATSESARKRHARRAWNASRGIAEARRSFAFMAMTEA